MFSSAVKPSSKLHFRRLGDDMLVLRKNSPVLRNVCIEDVENGTTNDSAVQRSMLLVFRNVFGAWVRRVGIEDSILADDKRTPQFKLIACDPERNRDTVVTVKENSIYYKFDVSEVMFSKGNFKEKKRMKYLNIEEDEVIVDMFAGYFSIPLLNNKNHVKHLYAIDHNPLALKWLRQNMTINKIQPFRYTIIEGDCTKLCPVAVANRVILGLIPSSEVGFERALAALKNDTGVLHIHTVALTNAKLEEIGNEIIGKLSKISTNHFALEEVCVVKSYAPNLTHYVVDIDCRK